MAEKQSYAEQNKARLKGITDSIETGIKELFESEKYKQYLSTMSRFHKYSVNNTMLIYMQRPDATHVAGFNKWRDNFGRNVLKGEKGIKIIAPTPYKKKIEQEKLDPDTKLPIKDENGDTVMEEKTIQIPMYKPVTVFDVAQTEGKPLPELAANLTGDVQNYEVFMEALRRSAPVPLEFEKMTANMDGYFSLDNQRIAIRKGMSEVQTVCAAVHEIAHSKLHNKDEIGEKYQSIELFDKPALFSNGRIDPKDLPEGLYAYDLCGSDDDPGMPITIESHVTVNHAASVITAEPIELPEQDFLYLGEEGLNFTGGMETVKEFYHTAFPEKAKISRATEEIQAESISFAVCAYYGIQTGENSFGYLATWAKDKELTELRASLETINKTSSALITDIDRNYAEIMKERRLDKEPVEVESTEKPVSEMNVLEMVDHFMEQGMTEEQANELANSEWQARKMQDTIEEIAIHVQEEPPMQAPDNGYVPDPAISVESMNAYGYTDSAMLPLTKERALELMERDVTVYMLYTDNTEAMAFDNNEIMSHDGIFGIETSEWENYRSQNAMPPMGSFSIYQLKEGAENRDYSFRPLSELQSAGLSLDRNRYELKYADTMPIQGDVNSNLETLYHRFNVNPPDDFHGHSLSVSDIVVLRTPDAVSYHYVDSVGFRELTPEFKPMVNPLKNAEMAMEDDYGMIDGIINNGSKHPSVAELEQQAKSGKPISLMDLAAAAHRERKEKKPSVLEKVKSYQKKENTAQKKSAEMEI